MVELVSHQTQSDPGRPRLGGFELGVRDSTFSQQGTVVAVHATGVTATPYAGYPATCYGRPLAPETTAAILATPWFAQAKTIRHDRIIPVIDAGMSGQTAFFIEPAISGERVSQRLRNRTETTPVQAGRILADVWEGVGVAWQAGYDLVIDADTVRIVPNGRAQMSLALSMCLNPKPGPGSDSATQFQLALLAAFLLSGLADQASLGIEILSGPDRALALSSFRERLGNLAEHVAVVIAKALNNDPAQRYQTTQGFLVAYNEGLKATADELAFGAIEAKNRDGNAMAVVYAELITRYDENHPEVAGPGGRLNGAFHPGMATTMPIPQPIEPIQASIQPAPPASSAVQVSVGTEPPLAPEIVAMLAGPAYQPSKPKTNPWIVFAAGTIVILTVFLFLAFLAMTNS